ncbi:MAG: hypothetical protein HFF18_04195 [Oscillospiraceae bacterium]|nr:hypothetical protein [Oscillospiraceae bacterium]
MEEKCTVDPQRGCEVRQMVRQVEADLHDLRRQNSGTHERFGERIGDLEAHNKVQDVEVKNLGKSIDSMSGDLREVKSETKEISKQLPVIANQVNAIHESQRAVDTDVDALKEKPAKRWESMVGQIIGIVVAAVMGFILAKIGLSG